MVTNRLDLSYLFAIPGFGSILIFNGTTFSTFPGHNFFPHLKTVILFLLILKIIKLLEGAVDNKSDEFLDPPNFSLHCFVEIAPLYR